MLILSIKKKTIITFIIIIAILSLFLSIPAKFTVANYYTYTIVIDAGHGGEDGGSVSPYSGIDENHINLDYAFCLKKQLNQLGFNVIMTRQSLGGLYPLFSVNRKKDDMQERKRIIRHSKADMVISIHMNSFPLKSSKGSQVFYKKDDQSSKVLADNIQNVFIQNLPEARLSSQSGDYFILNCSNITSVIVECGFLSNQEEESRLVTKEYRELVCKCIAYGIILTLSY